MSGNNSACGLAEVTEVWGTGRIRLYSALSATCAGRR